MAGEWAQTTVGEVAHRVTKGTTPTTVGGRFAGSGISFVKVESITDDGRFLPEKFAFIDEATNRLLERSVLQEDDVLFTIAGTIGRVAKVDSSILPANTNQAIAIIRPNRTAVDPRFLYFALRDAERVKHAHTRVVQSVQANFSLSELSSIELPLPPVAEQRAIAHLLGTLDDKIELSRRMSETLEAMARALFRSWFVDFDPVRAKSEGRAPGLPKPLSDLFPDSFEDSELGEIPRGWAVMPIGDLADVVGGSTPKTERSEYWEGGTHHWVTPKDLSGLSMPVLLDTDRKITDRGLEQISSGLLPAGTVLLSSRAPIGYLAIAEAPVAVNQGFIAMKPRANVASTYLLQWARENQSEIVSRANGSTFLEISKSNFRPIPVVTPSPEVMQAFSRQIEPIYERIVSNERESKTLAVSRDSILPKLISGELRVAVT
jgi:type I restriction enzyme, S subunit